MKKPRKVLYPYLIYAGVSPYFITSVLFVLGFDSLAFIESLKEALSLYNIIIISFLAGSHWGKHLENPSSFYLALNSTGLAVFIGFSYLLLSFPLFLLAFSLSLALLLWIDKKLLKKEMITQAYFKTRSIATGLTFLNLLIIGFFS